jgi:hypothetical protein
MKNKLIIIVVLIFWLFSCWNWNIVVEEINTNNTNAEKIFDFSSYYSDQCPTGEIMISWTENLDWTLKVNKCVKPFTCFEWKEIISQCSSMLWNIPCKLYCHWINIPLSEW